MGNLCNSSEQPIQKKSEMISNGCCLKFVCGDITSEKTEVIVNPSSTDLQFSSSLSIDISRKGGPEISSQCLNYILKSGPIPVGEIAVTTGGFLYCKKIAHIIGPIYCSGVCQESQLLANCIRKVIELADDSGFHSVAFPIFASGPNFFPVQEIAYVFYIVISEFDFANSSVKEIRFVNKDLHTLKEFEAEFRFLVKDGVCCMEEVSTQDSQKRDILNYSF